MSGHVLISCLHLQRHIDQYARILEANGITYEIPVINQQLREEDLLTMIDRFDGIIAGDDHLTANVLDHAKRLKVISKWGVGIDNIDQEAAIRNGIQVKNTPAVFSDEVADVAIGYLLLLSRKLHIIDRNVRQGEWNQTQISGTSLGGKTLGIVGVGNIGREMAMRGAALKMSLLGYDPFPPPAGFLREVSIRMVSLDQLISGSDYISLHCNLTKENFHMLGAPQFDMMKKGVGIINTSRGGLIHEKALVDAMQSGIVGSAALDVFECEPLPINSPLRKFENCILGCHNSSNTKEAVDRVNELAVKNLIEGLMGEKHS